MSEPTYIKDAATLKRLHCWIGSTDQACALLDQAHTANVRMNDMADAGARPQLQVRALAQQRLQIPLGRRALSVFSSAAIAGLGVTGAI